VSNSSSVNRRFVAIVVAALCLSVLPGEAQKYVAPRTPWGDPDLEGLWSNQTSTPLERPGALRDSSTLTPEEAEEREEAARLNADRPPAPGDPGTYNAFWRDPGKALTRTSLIVDPTDGRLPALTAEGRERVAAREGAGRARASENPWEQYPAWTRCITRGVIKVGSFYSSSHQIFQAPGYVVISQELIHESRIVPLDGRPPLSPAIRQWMGESRGRWEGTTLVVETDHIAAGYFDHEGTPQSDQIKTVERFIPNADYSRLDYILTTTDPVNFTKPFDLKRYFVWKPENRVNPYECLDRFEPGK